MTDRPLTTGEGNTAARARAEAWLANISGGGSPVIASEMARDVLALAAECGRLRTRADQLSGWYNRAEQHITELKAERDALREQLDGARQCQRCGRTEQGDVDYYGCPACA